MKNNKILKMSIILLVVLITASSVSACIFDIFSSDKVEIKSVVIDKNGYISLNIIPKKNIEKIDGLYLEDIEITCDNGEIVDKEQITLKTKGDSTGNKIYRSSNSLLTDYDYDFWSYANYGHGVLANYGPTGNLVSINEGVTATHIKAKLVADISGEGDVVLTTIDQDVEF